MKGRIAFIPAAHKIDFHEYDVPAPPAGGVVAEVTQTNVCGSEVHIWRERCSIAVLSPATWSALMKTPPEVRYLKISAKR